MLIQTEARIIKGDVVRVLPSSDIELRNVIAVVNMKESVSLTFPYSSIKGSYTLNNAEIFVPNIILSHTDISALPAYMQNEIRKKERENNAESN